MLFLATLKDWWQKWPKKMTKNWLPSKSFKMLHFHAAKHVLVHLKQFGLSFNAGLVLGTLFVLTTLTANQSSLNQHSIKMSWKYCLWYLLVLWHSKIKRNDLHCKNIRIKCNILDFMAYISSNYLWSHWLQLKPKGSWHILWLE